MAALDIIEKITVRVHCAVDLATHLPLSGLGRGHDVEAPSGLEHLYLPRLRVDSL